MAKKPSSRWVTVRARFDYRWPSGAITHFSERDFGEHRVKNEVADFAVERGYAVEGRLEEQGTGATADNRSDDAVAQPGVADADRPAGRKPVDPDAE
jgi:hypothetical protein